jgi:hypothetical protein
MKRESRAPVIAFSCLNGMPRASASLNDGGWSNATSNYACVDDSCVK